MPIRSYSAIYLYRSKQVIFSPCQSRYNAYTKKTKTPDEIAGSSVRSIVYCPLTSAQMAS